MPSVTNTARPVYLYHCLTKFHNLIQSPCSIARAPLFAFWLLELLYLVWFVCILFVDQCPVLLIFVRWSTQARLSPLSQQELRRSNALPCSQNKWKRLKQLWPISLKFAPACRAVRLLRVPCRLPHVPLGAEAACSQVMLCKTKGRMGITNSDGLRRCAWDCVDFRWFQVIFRGDPMLLQCYGPEAYRQDNEHNWHVV